MSTQTTITIDRGTAIERISTICYFIRRHDYRSIESNTYDPELDLEYWVDNTDVDITHIKKWTNRMLKKVMDRPLFRRSMFDNYTVVDFLE